MALRARDKTYATGRLIVDNRAGARHAGLAAEGLFKANGLTSEACRQIVCAQDDSLVDERARHSRNHEIAKAEFLPGPEINVDPVSEQGMNKPATVAQGDQSGAIGRLPTAAAREA